MMKLIHITDTHFVPRGKTLFGGDPLKNLERCVADINLHHADAEVCVLTGDLTHWGEPEAYEALRECLDPMITPLRVIIGNHDVRNEMFRWFPKQPLDENGFYQFAEDFSAGRFLFLDTHEPGKHEGHYCEKRLDWLERQLTDSGKNSLFLFMHHPPLDVGHPTLDRIGLNNKEAFTRTVRPHCGRIRHLFFGHIHRPLSGHWLGISMSSLRGINHQVWLDFEETAGDVVHLLLAALLDQADGARFQVGDQRRVARGDTQVTQSAVRDNHLDQAGEDLRLGADDVAMDCYGHTLASHERPSPGAQDYSFLAFSTASSIPPTM